jgi:hypothetical protein
VDASNPIDALVLSGRGDCAEPSGMPSRGLPRGAQRNEESLEYTPYRDPRQQVNFEAHVIRRGEIPRFVTMPVFCTSVHRHPSRSASQAMYRRL